MAVGTGGKRYAQAFIEEFALPFEVLLDDDGTAAEIVGTNKLTVGTLVNPKAVAAGARSLMKAGRNTKTGRRPFQLGATLVIAPGNELLYSDYEAYAGDHADIDEVLGVLRS